MENDAVKFQMDEMRPRFERIANRKENGLGPRAVTAFQLFQTPEPIARRMADLIPLEASTVLEPSAGLGRIYKAVKEALFSPRITLVEKNPDCAGELYRLIENDERANLKQGDFLDLEPVESFDAVVMNPPFHMRSDIRHIEHALKFLKPGGTLIGICMNTRHREEALMSRASHWEELEPGTFKEEGTRIDTVLLTIEKDER